MTLSDEALQIFEIQPPQTKFALTWWYEVWQTSIHPNDSHKLLDAIVASIPGGADAVLYARVDLIPDDEGTPLLLELELTEPSLFLSHCAQAPARMAAAIAARL